MHKDEFDDEYDEEEFINIRFTKYTIINKVMGHLQGNSQKWFGDVVSALCVQRDIRGAFNQECEYIHKI